MTTAPLFREKDRESLQKAFDLFDYSDVSGSQVETFQRRMDLGKPA